MINFAPKYGTDEKAAILEVLEQILPEEYNILFVGFEVVKGSNIIKEAKFKLKCRVNIESKEQIDPFICQFGDKTSLKATDREKEGRLS